MCYGPKPHEASLQAVSAMAISAQNRRWKFYRGYSVDIGRAIMLYFPAVPCNNAAHSQADGEPLATNCRKYWCEYTLSGVDKVRVLVSVFGKRQRSP